MDRRAFFKRGFAALGAIGLARVLGKSETAFAKAKPASKSKITSAMMFTEKDSVSVGQFCNTKTAHNKKCTSHKAGQECSKCQFFTKAGSLSGKEVGKCQIIGEHGNKKYVYGDYWCQTFVPKA